MAARFDINRINLRAWFKNHTILKSRLTISTKILFIWATTIIAALALVAILFQFLLSRYNETIAKEQLTSAYISLNQQLDRHMVEMISKADSLATRENIINSMNFISKYQNKSKYDAIAFDGERKRLALQLAETTTDYTEIILYDRDQDISALKYCDPDDTNHVAITSYLNGKPVLLSALEGTINFKKSALWDGLHVYNKAPNIMDLSLSERDGTIHADVLSSIVRGVITGNHEIVGMVQIGDNISKYVAVTISPLIGLPANLYSKSQIENLLLSLDEKDNSLKNSLDELSENKTNLWVETTTHYWNIHPLSLQDGFTAYISITVDKSSLNLQFSTLMDSVFLVMFIMILFLLSIGIWFIQRIITQPVQMLLDGVQQISDGKYDALKLINSHDELGSLARSFETMAKEVQIREKKLADILGLAPEGIVAINETFKITLFNRGAERVFGYNAKEVLGMPLNILLPKRFRDGHNKHIKLFDASEIAYSKMGRRGEILGLHKSGEEFPAAASISKLTVDTEKVYTVLIQDITERKNAEAALVSAKLDAEMANESKSHFLASMSHELRTPLNAIIGMSDMIKGEYFGDLNEKYREYAGDIVHSGEHLLSLVNELLDISTIEAGKQELKKENLSVRTMVDDCFKIVKIRAEQNNVSLHQNIPDALPTLVADMQAVRKVLLNLLSNAVKFMPEGGKVDVSASEDSAYIIIAVKDDGPGIPKDKISGLMKPFARLEDNAHKAVEGWGLGLAISKSLMDMHGGTIRIESVEGKGTTVFVSFPKKTLTAN